MNKKQTNHHSAQHPHHEQDNCDGCQAERSENNKLVDFYQRLASIEQKVEKIKDHVAIQKQAAVADKEKIQNIATLLLKKPEEAIQQIKQQDAKQMGYELASALIEREIKVKAENEKLQAIIQQLLKDKLQLEEERKLSELRLSQPNSSNANHLERQPELSRKEISRYSDVLDEVRRTNSIDSTYFSAKNQKKKEKQTNSSYFADPELHQNYWETGQAHSGTSFSNFTQPLTRHEARYSSQGNKYEGLNLWLYDFKTDHIDDNPIKSLRKPTNKYQKNTEAKYKPKF